MEKILTMLQLKMRDRGALGSIPKDQQYTKMLSVLATF